MSKKPVVASPDTGISKIWELIFEKRISGIPIVDKKNRIKGIISEEDIISKLYPSYEQYFFDPMAYKNFEQMEKNISKIKNLEAKDIMNKEIYTAEEDNPIMKAASSMLVYKVSCLPVVKKETKDKLVGIICKGDIFSELFKAHINK